MKIRYIYDNAEDDWDASSKEEEQEQEQQEDDDDVMVQQVGHNDDDGDGVHYWTSHVDIERNHVF